MAEDTQKQIDELKRRITALEFLLSLGAELISQLSIDVGGPDGVGPHEEVCANYSKLCEEILLSEKNDPKDPKIDGDKYPKLVLYIHEQKLRGR